jgi:2',3'-cyclic-nucleotide 2'-phosphodiesterase (5'-nucleotidase family)
MGDRSRGAMVVTLALGILVAATATGDAGPRRESNAEVMLISFGGTNGELKDCGCHSNPMGGLSHRASFLDSLRVRGKEFLLVDLGDFMSTETVVADMKNRFLWKKMEEMGYCATTPGAREISDWTRYQEMLHGSPIRSIASNLVVEDGGKEAPAGLAYRIEETHGVRVALFSLIGPQELSTAAPPQGLTFRARDPFAAAAEIVPQLRKKADVVVLMSQLSSDQTHDLLVKVPGIDVTLCGRQPQWFDVARVLSETIVQETGNRGSQVGELILIIDPHGKVVEWGSRNDALGPSYGEDLDLTAQIEAIENQAKEMITQDQQRKAGAGGDPVAPGASATPDAPGAPRVPADDPAAGQKAK